MVILGVKLKPGVTLKHLESFINKTWVPELSRSTRAGTLTSLIFYGVRQNDPEEFAFTIDGFLAGPSTDELEKLCDITYRLDCQDLASWPKSPAA